MKEKFIRESLQSILAQKNTNFDNYSSLSKVGAEDTVLSYRCFLEKSAFIISNNYLLQNRSHSSNICNSELSSPFLTAIKRMRLQTLSHIQILFDINKLFLDGKIDYRTCDKLLRKVHAEQRRSILFPYIEEYNDFVSKFRWFFNVIYVRPDLFLKSLVRLCHYFIIKLYKKFQ